ncbi:MAG: hypothetical protein Q8Q24_00735 [bacterium]|nr:hypothetical protein [bacterium]
MITLTAASYYTRRIIKFGSISLVAFLILRFIFGISVAYWKKLHPPPPPPPTVAFGKLPALTFPKIENLPSMSFKLETIEGILPKLDSQSKVYFIPKANANLLALDRTRALAASLGFQSDPKQISDRTYLFSGKDPNSSLEIDIITLKFKMIYNFTNDQSILAEKKLPDSNQTIQEGVAFFNRAGLMSDDLITGEQKISYWRYIPPDLQSVVSLSEADFVRVDFFRADIEKFKVLPPNPKQAQVSLMFSGNRDLAKRIVEADYLYRPISKENPATYPLKTAEAAWQDLTGGKGYIASLGENDDGRITVRKVSLAYYESNDIQNFLQPIYVFEGDHNFMAYVPAVDSQWVE